METFPPTTTLDVDGAESDDAGVPDRGHLWILEDVDGGPLRFRLRADGRIEFGDDGGTFGGEVPPEYAAAVRQVRERLDREGLSAALDDVAGVTFFGVATYRRRVAYDFDHLPAFLGTEVHDGEAYLPPDAAESVYDRLGLTPVPAVRKEVRAVDFDPGSYDVPTSAYADGPALGAILRTKTGERARIPGPPADRSSADPVDGDPETLAERFATDRRIAAARRDAEAGEASPAFEAVFERVVERIYREEAHCLTVHGADVDRRAFRSAVASRVRRRIDA